MDEEMMTMQEEALRRVREMQRRSQSYVGHGGQEGHEGQESEPAAQRPGEQLPKLPLIDLAGLKIDEEKAMIGLLIYILYKNKADMKLILALGYLLL